MLFTNYIEELLTCLGEYFFSIARFHTSDICHLLGFFPREKHYLNPKFCRRINYTLNVVR